MNFRPVRWTTAFSSVPVRLKTVCDVKLELAEKVKARYGYEQAAADFPVLAGPVPLAGHGAAGAFQALLPLHKRGFWSFWPG